MIAGVIGVDPRPFTLRQLLWMHQGAGRDRWSHTSLLCALLYNAHRDPRRGRVLKPADFDPYAQRDRKHTRRVASKDDLVLLRQALEAGR